MRRLLVLGLMLAILPACGTRLTFAMIGTDVPDSQVATIVERGLSSKCYGCVYRLRRVDDDQAVYDFERDGLAESFRLIPGAYEVLFGVRVSGNFVLNPRKRTVEFRPGHSYSVRKQGYGGVKGTLDRLWILDDTTGEEVAGDGVPTSPR